MAFRNPGGIKFAQLPTVPAGNIGGTNQSLVIRTTTGGSITIETLDGDAGIIHVTGAAGVSLDGAFVSMDAPRMYLDGPISPTSSFEPGNVIESDDSGTPNMRLFVDDNGHMILSAGGSDNQNRLEITTAVVQLAADVGTQLLIQGDDTVIGAASELEMAVPHQTTVGAAGGASALPATPKGYMLARIDGAIRAFPYYLSA